MPSLGLECGPSLPILWSCVCFMTLVLSQSLCSTSVAVVFVAITCYGGACCIRRHFIQLLLLLLVAHVNILVIVVVVEWRRGHRGRIHHGEWGCGTVAATRQQVGLQERPERAVPQRGRFR